MMQFDTASQNNCEELVKLLVHHCKKIDPGIWYISPGIKLRSDITIKGMDRESSILKRNDCGS